MTSTFSNVIKNHTTCLICNKLSFKKYNVFITQLLEIITDFTKEILGNILLKYGQSNIIIYQTLIDYFTYGDKNSKLSQYLTQLKSFIDNKLLTDIIYYDNNFTKKLQYELLMLIYEIKNNIFIYYRLQYPKFNWYYTKLVTKIYNTIGVHHNMCKYIEPDTTIFNKLCVKRPGCCNLHNTPQPTGLLINLQQLGYIKDDKKYVIRLLGTKHINHYGYIHTITDQSFIVILFARNLKRVYIRHTCFVELFEVTKDNLKLKNA